MAIKITIPVTIKNTCLLKDIISEIPQKDMIYKNGHIGRRYLTPDFFNEKEITQKNKTT